MTEAKSDIADAQQQHKRSSQSSLRGSDSKFCGTSDIDNNHTHFYISRDLQEKLIALQEELEVMYPLDIPFVSDPNVL